MCNISAIWNKVKKKFSGLNAPAKASIAFTICSILQRGLSTITVPIFTRLLTTEQYGVYSVYTSWYSIIQIFATLNLYCGVFNNGMVKYPSDRSRFQSSMLGLSTTVTVILCVIYFLFSDFWDSVFGLSKIFILLMFVELLFIPAFQFWSARERFSYRYKSLVVVTLLMAVASPVIGVIAVLSTEYKAEARVFSYVLVQVVVGIVLYIKTFLNGKKFYIKEYWKFALAFNVPLIPHYLSGMILNQADRIMINNMIGTSEAAIYSVAYNLAFLVSIFTTSINNSFVPYTYQKMSERAYDDIKKTSRILQVLVLGLIVLLILFAPELMAIFATQEYYEAVWIVPTVAMSVFFNFMYSQFVNIEFYFEENRYIAFASCGGAILNIVLNYFFIKKYGYIAAGYTTLICYVIFMFAHYIFYKIVIKKNSIDKVYDIRSFLLLSVIALGLMVVVMLLYPYQLLRYCFIAIAGFLVIWKKNYIMKVINEIKKK